MWPGAPTVEELLDQTTASLKRLRRHPFCDLFPNALNVAAQMEACRPGRRCGICPCCVGTIQRAVVDDGLALVSATPSRFATCKMTVVFPSGRVPVGGLSAPSFTPLSEDFLGAVAAYDGVAWVQGGFDVSYNDDRQKGLGAVFQIHMHGTCAVDDYRSMSAHLSARFPKTEQVYRPVLLKPCTIDAYTLSYSCKTKFYRRDAHWATRRDRPCWHTSHRALRARQDIELLLAFAELGPSDRLLFFRRNLTQSHQRRPV
jgi:hypothetical protein